MDIREQIEKYILGIINEPRIDHCTNLFDSGLISSLDVLDLIAFLETTFNFSISDEDISVKNLGSIDSIVNLIQKLKQTG